MGATDRDLTTARVSDAMPINTQSKRTTFRTTTNHFSSLQVVVALTNLQTSLAGVQNGLNHLLRAYMQHTQSVVAGEDADFEKLQLPAGIAATANAVMDAATGAESIAQAITAPSQPAETAAADGTNKKRKREKKIKDPNAPKKPLTAAFLYAQTARPIVRADLESALAPGQVLEKNAVNLEVTKRWNELSDEEKEVSLTSKPS